MLSFMAEILLFNSVFYDGVAPVSVSTLKPLLGVIGVLPLKPLLGVIGVLPLKPLLGVIGVLPLKSQASPILSVCI